MAYQIMDKLIVTVTWPNFEKKLTVVLIAVLTLTGKWAPL